MHVVFYLVFEEEIEVVRALHASMDATSLLDE
jgi:plasmid stabilization system protein ParE